MKIFKLLFEMKIKNRTGMKPLLPGMILKPEQVFMGS